MRKEITLYCHSKCCDAHWELVYYPKKKTYDLICEVCGKTAGSIKVHGPILGPVCSKCKETLEK